MMSHTQSKITDLRQQSLQKVLESVLGFIAALYTTLLLPQLLVRYVYADQQLTAEPKALELIPVVCFAAAILYLIYTVIGNIGRANQIKRLQTELEEMGDECGCSDHDLNDQELAELESMVEEALVEDNTTGMAAAMKSNPSSRKASNGQKAKKTTKKSKK